MLCGKIIYHTRPDAIEAMRSSHTDQRKWKRTRKKAVYYCEDCKAWHTTTAKTNLKVKKRRFAEQKAKDEKLFHTRPVITKHHILHIHTPNKFRIK